jgi:hypothetical protein
MTVMQMLRIPSLMIPHNGKTVTVTTEETILMDPILICIQMMQPNGKMTITMVTVTTLAAQTATNSLTTQPNGQIPTVMGSETT